MDEFEAEAFFLRSTGSHFKIFMDVSAIVTQRFSQ
jgi:hypothetical protein